MPRKKKGDGSISSERGVREALARREQIADELERLRARLAKSATYQTIEVLQAEDAALDRGVKLFVLGNYAAGEGYEDDGYRITKVVPHTRVWNADKLRQLVRPAIFRKITRVVVEPAKVDELVSAGEIDLDAIDEAYESTQNSAYTRMTKKKQVADNNEAEDLAAALA